MKKTIRRGIIIAVAAFSIFMLYEFATFIYAWINDHETSSKIPLAEYNNLFNQDAQGKLQILATVISRNRKPVSTYVYDKRYNICVFKVILLKDSDLKSIINYQNETSNKSLNAVYSNLPSFNFGMSIRIGKSVTVTTVHFRFNGDSIKLVAKNDSLNCYYYKFSSFSINYNDEPYDIVAKADRPSIPASLIFKKKGKVLYVILMSVAEGREVMRPDLLYNIINK